MMPKIQTSSTVHYQDMGVISYKPAWEYQEKILSENVHLKADTRQYDSPLAVPTHQHLLLCEHTPVYTLGKSGKREHLLISEEECLRRGIEFYHTNRGGDITYHGPGQITGYPILDLEKFKPDIAWYVRQLEEVFIQLLDKEYGLPSGRIEGASGVWMHIESDFPRKICAIGVKCSRWITIHGFAFNVNTDLDYFSHILPCGLEGKGATSLQRELGVPLDFQLVKQQVKKHFSSVFGFEYV